MSAKRAGRVPYRGTWVTPRGKEIYELLARGIGPTEVAKRTGTPIGSMNGYVQRAQAMGTMPRKRRVICAVSEYDGTRYRCRGCKEVERVMGVAYSTAWRAAKQNKTMLGFHWYFEG